MKVWVILEHGIEYTDLIAVCTTREKAEEIVATLPVAEPPQSPLSWVSWSYDIVEMETDVPPEK